MTIRLMMKKRLLYTSDIIMYLRKAN